MKMKKILVSAICTVILLCMGMYVNAADEWEYALENNLLYGVDPSGITISHGTVGNDGVTLEVLYDGLYETIDGYMGTRWAVENDQINAWIDINMGKLCTLNRIMLITGYPSTTTGGEQWEAFDLYYWDGMEYVLLKSVSGNTSGVLELSFDEITTNVIRIESRTDKNFRVREVIFLAPGTNYKTSFPTIKDNLTELQFSYAQPFLKDDRHYVHARELASQMGYKYEWNDAQRKMTFKKNGEEISFVQDSLTAEKNGAEIAIDASCYAYGGREYLPIREFCRLTDRMCGWNRDTNTVTMVTEGQYYTFTKTEHTYTPYEIEINGEKQRIFSTINCDFVQYSCQDTAQVCIRANIPVTSADIRPSAKNKEYAIENGELLFTAESGEKLSIEINGDKERPLFLFVNKPYEQPESGNVIVFEANKVHEAGKINLSSNTTVYLGDNAIVKGIFSAEGAENVHIIGNGIIVGLDYGGCTTFIRCNNVGVDGPVCIGGDNWLNKWFESTNITAHNYKILGSGVYSDGIDLLANCNVEIDDIFVRNEDDGIAIKTKKYSYSGNVENISIKNSTFWSGHSGNSIEIGYETDGELISGILISNIDVIHRGTQQAKYNRAAISIHHAGNSLITDVEYDTIRVEESEESVVHIECFSGSNWGSGGGSIENVTVKNLDFTGKENATSYIKMAGSSTIENITFVNMSYQGKKIKSAADAAACGFVVNSSAKVNFVWEEEE